MKINVYTIAWQDEFMLPHFLQHYSQYADNIFVIDDHSTDLTAAIANAHPLVKYSKYPGDGLDEELFNETFHAYYKNHSSDWAICVDTDEFIFGLDTLENHPPGVLKTRGYMMIGKTGRLEDCKKVRMPSFDKPVVFDPSLDVRFGPGRHSCNFPTIDSNLELRHFKYPSREFYIERNTEGYRRYMDETTAKKMLKKGLSWYDANI